MLSALSLISLFAAAPAFAKSTVHNTKTPAVARADKAADGDAKPAPEGDAKPAKTKKPKKTTKKTEKTEAAPEAAPAK